MGIFDIFKRKEHKEEEKQIRPDELDEWFESLLKDLFTDMNSKLDDIRKRLDYEKQAMRGNIRVLKEAKLTNTKIPERAIHLMEGNRESYMQKLNALLDEISLPEKDISNYCRSFDIYLNNFSKNTLRNYHILLEFFKDYVVNISLNIKNLDSLVKHAKKIADNSGIEKINTIKKSINELNNKIRYKRELNERIEISRKDIQIRMNYIESNEKRLKILEESSEYKSYMGFVNKKDLLEQEIKEMGQQFLFDIKNALRKYERLSLDDKLIRGYIDNSVKTLLEDQNLKIVEIVHKMKESIIDGKLELNEKKKDRILDEINRLDRDYFVSFLDKYNRSNKELEKLKLEIGGIKLKELEDLRKELEQDKEEAEENNDKIGKMIKELEKINIKDLSLNLENEIHNVINKKVKII